MLTFVLDRGNKKSYTYVLVHGKRNIGELRQKLIKLLTYRVCEISQITNEYGRKNYIGIINDMIHKLNLGTTELKIKEHTFFPPGTT